MDADGDLRPIGVVRSSRTEVRDDGWEGEDSSIQLLPPFDERALEGLHEFSHCMVVFRFNKAQWDASRMVRHPRGDERWPEVGIFAQRAKDRPNRLGVTICGILGVEATVLTVAGLDAIDGTPVIDIKPHMVEFDARGPVFQPAWATDLMSEYW